MVICCIGTPKVIGDSLAPRVGDALLHHNIGAFVYGTTSNPITALNYETYYNHIFSCHKNDFIIAVDCALGEKKDIGSIKITKKGVLPGKAIGKNLASIGNIGILGQVGHLTDSPFDQLAGVDDQIVCALAEKITNLILDIFDAFYLKRKQENLNPAI